MIQEKDFLYRVPVKNALVTTPNQQVRNPEILVDLEGGEFMHGNILDANSTNKLINQSVKDAVDNKLIESGYVTQDLLDAETTRATEQENSLKTLIGAETSARTKGDEDLGAKIKAEQTRAEGKEKEISDKLAIVDGDSNTEGSFRKAIADVIAAAPEDLDTLKEIADKLADNDDLHTALNQAITDKADASALLNEVTRATGAESALQTAIDTKQPKGNYLTEHQSLEEYAKKTDIPEIDTSDFVSKTATDNQIIRSSLNVKNTLFIGNGISASGDRDCRIKIYNSTDSGNYSALGYNFVSVRDRIAEMRNTSDSITSFKLDRSEPTGLGDAIFSLSKNGVRLLNGDNNHVLTSNASTIDITQYALKTELPTVPTAVSQLTNDSNFITAADIDFTPYATMEALIAETKARTLALTTLEQRVTDNTTTLEGKQNQGNYVEYIVKDNTTYTIDKNISISDASHTTKLGAGYFTTTYTDKSGARISIKYSHEGIKVSNYRECLATSDGTFKPISDFVLKTDAGKEYVAPDDLLNELNGVNADITSIRREMDDKQDKIKVNSVDVQNLDRANIDQLIAIVKELLIALDSSGLIIMENGVE